MIRSIALLLLFTPSLSWAQSTDDPWGSEEESTGDVEGDAPELSPEETTDDPLSPDATDTLDEEPALKEAGVEEIVDETEDASESNLKPVDILKEKAKRVVLYGENFKASGNRILGYGTGTGVSLGMKTVAGRDGGTTAGFISTNYTADKWGISASLPFVMHRVPGFRFDNTLNYSDGLGNLAIDGHYVLSDSAKVYSVIALETHFNLGSRAYTWVNDGDEIWPSNGVDVAWQGVSGDKLKKLYRLSMGLHFSKGNQPFPSFFPRFSAAFGLDRSLNKHLGITAEASLNYWDTSPFELSAFLRADALDGLRFRGGFVLPVATWAGLVPSTQEPGLSESTFVVDMRYAF